MRKYKHWLVLDKMNSKHEEINELIQMLVSYKEKYNAEVNVYFKNNGAFIHTMELISNQNYNELDLPCNTSDNSFQRLKSKPKGIYKAKDFNEYIKQYGIEFV